MVMIREALTIDVIEPDNLADRLQAEKTVLLNKVRQEGFELGIRSSAKLSYKEFRHFERVMPLAGALDDDVMEYLWSFLDQKEYPQDARLHDPAFAYLLTVDPASRIVFAQGWLDGVVSVWQTIKAQVETVQ